MASSSIPSLKFWANQLARTIVQRAPAVLDDPLGGFDLWLTAAGEQHELLDTGVDGGIAEPVDGVDGAGHGEVGGVGDVRRGTHRRGAAGQVSGRSQSNGGVPEREATRTAT